MVSCGNLLKSVLVAVVLATLAGSGSAQWKHSDCCKEVSSKEITEPIIGYELRKGNPPCVPAVIFLTEKGHYCTYIKAPWVMDKADLSTLHTLAYLLTCRIIFSPNSPYFHSF
uniref:Chemokine interleukin-8-like domain-containing protein n=1 Tax=Myripristis murdjan TaxID=586833 RepID=A0A667YRZ6_9TELE